MALDPQTIQFPLIKGVNTKVDVKQISFGEMSLLENAVFNTVNKFRKRNGYEAQSTTVLTPNQSFSFPKATTTITNGSWAAAFKNEKVMGDGFSLYSYSGAGTNWVYKGRCQSARVALDPVYQTSTLTPSTTAYSVLNNAEHADGAVNSTSGYSLYAWEMNQGRSLLNGTYVGVGYTLIDSTTSETIFTASLADTCSRPRCVAIGSLLYLLYYEAGEIKARSITNTGAGAATSLVNNVDTTVPNFDVLVNDDLIYVGYNGTGSTVKVASFNSALTNQASVSKAEVATEGIGIFTDSSDNIWVAYNNATDIKAFIMNAALGTTVLAPTTVEAGVSALGNGRNVTGCYDGTRGIIFYDLQGVPRYTTPAPAATSANFVQPAYGSTVTVNTSASVEALVGQMVRVIDAGGDGGFYYLSTATATSVTLVNLGDVTDNSAPGSTVNSPVDIYACPGTRISQTKVNTLTAAGVAGTALVFAFPLGLVSRAFVYSGVASVVCGFESSTQPTNFLCSLYDVNTVTGVVGLMQPAAHFAARIASNFAGGMPTKGTLASVNNYSTNKYKVATLARVLNIEKTAADVSFTNFFNGVYAADLDLAPSQVSKQELGDNLHIASGSLMMYDGSVSVEHGFHQYPEYLQVADSGLTGRLAAGTYGYVAVYAWVDASGQTHRSAPSQIAVYEAGAADAPSINTISLGVTQKIGAYVEFYRTLVNGSVFYRIDSNFYNAATSGTYFPIQNSPNAGSISMIDTYSDAEISGNQQLYTTGEVENIVCPAPVSLSLFKNRLLANVADDRTTEWYSKQVIPGSPVEMSDFFVQNTDQATGSIVGCAQLDDKWIIFKGSNLFYVVGSGPAASGSNNDFSDPSLIATDVGLVDRNSIVAMPSGVMFKSDKGVYILDRSLQVGYIGAQVESYNAYSVISAQLISSVNQVRMILSSGEAIVYDYFVQQWTVFTNISAVDSMNSQGDYYYLKSNGTLLKETEGTHSDSGSFISMKLRTGWIQLAGVQGFQRLWRFLVLGEYASAHTLRVQVAYDYNATVAQTVNFTPGALLPYEWGISPARQKCAAIQITIQDVSTGTIGESYSLSNLAFEVGIKKGLNKLPASQSGG